MITSIITSAYVRFFSLAADAAGLLFRLLLITISNTNVCNTSPKMCQSIH